MTTDEMSQDEMSARLAWAMRRIDELRLDLTRCEKEKDRYFRRLMAKGF